MQLMNKFNLDTLNDQKTLKFNEQALNKSLEGNCKVSNLTWIAQICHNKRMSGTIIHN